MEKLRVFGRLVFVLLVLVSQFLVLPVRADPVLPPDSRGAGPAALPDYPEVRLRPSPVDATRFPTLQAAVHATVAKPVLDMKVLVLLDTTTYPGGTSFGGINSMITSYLEILGVPFHVIDVATRVPGSPSPADPEFFQAADLWEDNHGKYYAIFLATSVVWSPWIDGSGNPAYSGLNQAERDLIREYEVNFGVRRVTWYAFPNADDYGLTPVMNAGEVMTVTVPLTATFTPAGQTTFSYLQPDVPFVGSGVYGYMAQAAVGKDVTPLLQINDGVADRIILAIYEPEDAGQHMVFTVSGFYPADPPVALFARLLPYGIINWATRGRFLGERHLYFVGQPDDVLASGDPYDFAAHAPVDCDVPGVCDTSGGPQPYRNDPEDLQNLVDWMTGFRAGVPNAGDLKMEMPFNGQGIQQDLSATGEISATSLTAKAVELEGEFVWLNHTYSHVNLDEADAALARTQILSNTEVAEMLGFTDYITSTLLTGAYSGITNTTFITTAYDLGIRYLLVNQSVLDEDLVGALIPSYKNPSPNTGIPYPGQPELLLIPRYANNIFYFSTTPAEQADYYNAIPFYCPDYPAITSTQCFTYEEIIDTVTNQALGFLLDFSINPTMFHMNNLENYGGGRTLMTDYIEALYAKYNRYYADNVPVVSLRTQEIGDHMWQRMAFDASGVQAVIGCDDTITITTQTAARIPFTGVDYGGNTETYAGQPISYFQMDDNDTVTIPGTLRIPMAPGGLAAITTAGDVALSWQSTVSYTDGGPLLGTVRYRVYRSVTRGFDPGSGTLIAEITDTSYTDAGAAADDYSYAVTTVGEDCWGQVSDVARADAIGLPAAPTDLTATATGADVALTWQPVLSYTDGGPLLGGVVYRLYRGALPNFDITTATLVTETADTAYVHAAAAAVGYSYAVTAVGADAWGLESDPARWNAVRTPAAPTDLTATATGADVALTWQPVLSYTDGGPLLGGVVYRLYRGALPNFDITTATLVTETAESTHVHAAAAAAGYSYAVAAVGMDAWGLESDPARWTYVEVPDEPIRVFLPLMMRAPEVLGQTVAVGIRRE